MILLSPNIFETTSCKASYLLYLKCTVKSRKNNPFYTNNRFITTNLMGTSFPPLKTTPIQQQKDHDTTTKLYRKCKKIRQKVRNNHWNCTKIVVPRTHRHLWNQLPGWGRPPGTHLNDPMSLRSRVNRVVMATMGSRKRRHLVNANRHLPRNVFPHRPCYNDQLWL